MNQKINLEEMDDFLERINDVSKEIKDISDGKCTEEFRKKEKDREIKKEREELRMKIKEKEAHELRVKGRKGKGEKENYLDYCKFCQWEYILSTPNCLKCNKETMTQKERYALLLVKAKEYQDTKINKKERMKQWDLWKKTQSILHNKMETTNYSKWDYFESSEEEEEAAEPVLPTDNPAFQALEKDLEERNKKRRADLAEADKFKVLGNECMKKGEYELAVEKYSLGLSFTKDNMPLYLNRALARMKQGKHSGCIKDCSKVLEISELFEDGYTKSKDRNFKAFLRRAMSRKEKGLLNDAKYDIGQALLLEPSSTEALKLQGDIQLKIEFQMKSSEIKQKESKQNEEGQDGLTSREQVKRVLGEEKPEEKDLLLMSSLFEREDDMKVIFYEQKGIDKCVEWLQNGVDVYWFMNTLLRDQQVLLERFHQQKGIHFLLDNLSSDSQMKVLREEGCSQYIKKGHVYESCELLLTVSQNSHMRGLLQEEGGQLVSVYLELVGVVKDTQIVVSMTSLMGNLVYSSNRYKSVFMSQWDEYIKVSNQIMLTQLKSHKKAILRESYYNLMANLYTDNEIRVRSLSEKTFIMNLCQSVNCYSTYLKGDKINQHNATLGALLAVLLNLLYSDNVSFELSIEYQLPIYLQDILPLFSSPLLVTRAYALLAKFPPQSIKFKKTFLEWTFPLLTKQNAEQNVSQPIIRLLIKVLHCPQQKHTLLTLDSSVWLPLMNSLSLYLEREDEQLFCNSCNLAGYLLDMLPLSPSQPVLESSLYTTFTGQIPSLLKLIGDSIGNKRKNSAIFLAKLCRNSTNIQVMRDHHGLEILKSVAHLIVDPKQNKS